MRFLTLHKHRFHLLTTSQVTPGRVMCLPKLFSVRMSSISNTSSSATESTTLPVASQAYMIAPLLKFDTDCNPGPKLILTALEPEILTHVVEFLLGAAKVRYTDSPPNTTYIRYAFQPAILRVCKSLNAIATKVFHRNHFLRIKTSSTTLRNIIKNNSVRIWEEKTIGFKDYHLHLTINPRRPFPNDTEDQPPITFLICLDGMIDFTWALRLTDLFFQPGYNYTIRVGKNADGTTLGQKVQRLLLEPLHQVRNGPYATCTVTGNVDEALKEKTEKLMSPRIFWTRSRLWEFLDAVAYKQIAAHQAFANGSMLEAHALHHELQQSSDKMWPLRKQILQGDDARLVQLWLHLSAMNNINFALVELHYHWREADYEKVQDSLDAILHQASHDDVFSELSRKDQAVLHFLCGLSSLWFGLVAEVKSHFKRALDLFPDNRHYRTCASIADTYPFTRFVPYEGKHMQDIRTVMKMLPKQPLDCILAPGVSTLPSIDFERHVLQALGYTGFLLEGRVEQKQGWSYHWDGERQVPFDTHMADLFIRFHQDHIDVYDPADWNGLPMAGWVKPPYVQLEGLEGRGEEVMTSHGAAEPGQHHHHYQDEEHSVTEHDDAVGHHVTPSAMSGHGYDIAHAAQGLNHLTLHGGHQHGHH